MIAISEYGDALEMTIGETCAVTFSKAHQAVIKTKSWIQNDADQAGWGWAGVCTPNLTGGDCLWLL